MATCKISTSVATPTLVSILTAPKSPIVTGSKPSNKISPQASHNLRDAIEPASQSNIGNVLFAAVPDYIRWGMILGLVSSPGVFAYAGPP